MTLKEWRMIMGYSLMEVAAMLERKSPSTIYYWERLGVKRAKIRDELKRISLGKIDKFN